MKISLQLNESQQATAQTLLNQSDFSNEKTLFPDDNNLSIIISQFEDCRNLSCPMPLLRVKKALRTLPDATYVYLVASDKNSEYDLKSFCEKSKLTLLLTNSKPLEADENTPLFHFLITKT